MTLVVDAHHHLWKLDQPGPFDYAWMNKPELAPLRRDRMPDDLKRHLDAAGVHKTVVVQTQHHLEENRWALGLAERHDFIAGVVGWVDLRSEQCERQLLEFKDHPKFVGVRHVVQDEPDDDFIIRPQTIRGLRVLQKHDVPYDLLFFVRHLPHAATLADQLPNLRMVIDHLAKPRIKQGRTDGWIEPLRRAARRPNLFVKLSGLITEADWRAWKPADLRPYVTAALELFGPERCMFGTDWPVCELAGTYEQAHHALVEAIGPIGDDERRAVFGGTACRFYGLDR
jgi:L-fuconolactonase